MCEYRSRALSAPLLVDTLLIGQSRWRCEGDLNSPMNAAPVTDERHEAEEEAAVTRSDRIFRKSVSLRCSEYARSLYYTRTACTLHVRVFYSLQLVVCDYSTSGVSRLFCPKNQIIWELKIAQYVYKNFGPRKQIWFRNHRSGQPCSTYTRTRKLTSTAYHQMCILCIINRPGTVNALVFWLELDEPQLPSAGLLGASHQADRCQRLNESGHSPHASTCERPLPQWNSQYQQAVHLLRSPLPMRANDLLTFHCTLSHTHGLLSCDIQ